MPEVWRFDGSQLVSYGLGRGEYFERDASVAFPAVAATDVTAFIKESETMTRPEWVRKLRSSSTNLIANRIGKCSEAGVSGVR